MNDGRVRYETLPELVGRLNLDRDEVLQRLLTTLILNAPYPRWNTRSKPSPNGLAFLRSLHDLSFGSGWDGDDLTFVDEFEFAGRSGHEAGGSPDYTIVWPQRIWIIELKSEATSHRAAQLPFYLDLAHHHFPEALVDVTYVTPPLIKPAPDCEPWARYANVTWHQVVPLVRAAWPTATSAEQGEVIEGLCRAVDRFNLTPTEWRLKETTTPAAPFVLKDAINEGLIAANATALDGEERALTMHFPTMDSLLEYRIRLRELIHKHPFDSPMQLVRPWVWRAAASGGEPLSAQGAAEGYEVRLSRDNEPVGQ